MALLDASVIPLLEEYLPQKPLLTPHFVIRAIKILTYIFQ